MNDPVTDFHNCIRKQLGIPDSGRGEWTIRTEYPDGDYNRELIVTAGKDGIRIDDHLVMEWDWIARALQEFNAHLDTSGDNWREIRDAREEYREQQEEREWNR